MHTVHHPLLGTEAPPMGMCDALGNVPLGIPGLGLHEDVNAPCHTAHVVQEWLEEHDKEIEVLS